MNRKIFLFLGIGLVGTLFFLFLFYYLNSSYSGVYSIDLSRDHFTQTPSKIDGRSLYILDNPLSSKFGGEVIFDDDVAQDIKGSSVIFVWQPEGFLFSGSVKKKITFSADLKGEGKWFVNDKLFYDSGAPDQTYIFDFATINKDFSTTELEGGYVSDDKEQVYFRLHAPEFKEYEDQRVILSDLGYKAQSVSGLELWSKEAPSRALLKVISEKNSAILEVVNRVGFIGFNSLEEFDEEFNKFETDPKILIDSSQSNFINNIRLRGNQTFVAYLGDRLDLEVEKTDLNWYKGGDEVRVALVSFSGVEFCDMILSDDGESGVIGDGKRVRRKMTCKDLKPGPYFIRIIEEDEDRPADFLISGLSINTDKIMIKESVFTMIPLNVYTRVSGTKEVMIRQGGVDAAGFTITNSDGERMVYNLKKGEGLKVGITDNGFANISLPGAEGFVGGDYFAFAPEQWFSVARDGLMSGGYKYVIIRDAWYKKFPLTVKRVEISVK